MTEKNRHYIVTIVFKPEAKVAEVTKSIADSIGENGKIDSQEELTLKRLAYTISGTNEAPIHQLKVSGGDQLSQIISSHLHVQDQVLRFLITTVKMTHLPEKAETVVETEPEVKPVKKEAKSK